MLSWHWFLEDTKGECLSGWFWNTNSEGISSREAGVFCFVVLMTIEEDLFGLWEFGFRVGIFWGISFSTAGVWDRAVIPNLRNKLKKIKSINNF